MPNTPSLVGEGATVYSLENHCSAAFEGKVIETLCAGVGRVCHLVPESHIDAVTGISGSGPAYMYMIIGKYRAKCTRLLTIPTPYIRACIVAILKWQIAASKQLMMCHCTATFLQGETFISTPHQIFRLYNVSCLPTPTYRL